MGILLELLPKVPIVIRFITQHVLSFNLRLPNTPGSVKYSLNYNVHSAQTSVNQSNAKKKYIWDTRNIQSYLHSFSSVESQQLKSEFLCSLTCDTETACEKFYNFLHFSLNQSFKQKKVGKKKSTFPKNAWFDGECKQLKTHVNSFPKDSDISEPINWKEYCNLTGEYKRLVQMKKRQFKAANLDKFQNMLSDKPDDY